MKYNPDIVRQAINIGLDRLCVKALICREKEIPFPDIVFRDRTDSKPE